MNRLLITALLASVAFAPAYAGKDKDNGSIVDRADRAAEKFDSRIDRLENRLEDASDEERQRIENVIESVTEKYEQKWGLPEEPPPPPPPPPEEPVTEQLFSDDFNRANSPILGAPTEGPNSWQQSPTGAGISNQALSMEAPSDGKTIVVNYVPLGINQYSEVTLSYDLSANASLGSTLAVSASPDGANYTSLFVHDLGDPNIQDPQHFSWTVQSEDLGQYYAWKFELNAGCCGGATASFDNVVVTGVLWEDFTPALTQ
jgi:hypothetical protein